MKQLLSLLSMPLLLLSCSGVMDPDLTNEVIKERTNQEGIKKAVLFVKSGGATVGESYQVSILPNREKLDDEDTGNIFIADDHDGSISNDTSRVNFKWLSFDSLKISFDKKLRVFKRDTMIKDVTIIYDSLYHTTK